MNLRQVEFEPNQPGDWQLFRDNYSHPVLLACPRCGKLGMISSKHYTISLHYDGSISLEPEYKCSQCTGRFQIVHGNVKDVNLR